MAAFATQPLGSFPPKLNLKSVQCRDGTPHRIYADGSDTSNGRIHGAILKGGVWHVMLWSENGACAGDPDKSLIPKPKECEAWVNWYDDDRLSVHRTEELASLRQKIVSVRTGKKCIACSRVTLRDGEIQLKI